MYKQAGRGTSQGRSSFGGQKKGGYAGRSRNSRPRTNGRYGVTNSISHSRFIRKADPIIESAPFIPVNKFADFKIDNAIKINIKNKI